MKNLAEFKRIAKVGTKLHSIYHMAFAGRNEVTFEPIYKDEIKEPREISIAQTNAIALRTGEIDSWLYFPKAKDCEFIEDGKMIIYEENSKGERVKVLTYWIENN